MKKSTKYFIAALWVVFGGIVFGGMWLRNPSLWFINLPDRVWEFLVDVTGASCCESAADLEAAVGLGFGVIFASIILAAFILIKKRLSRPKSA